MSRILEPTEEDIHRLIREYPLAGEQLKSIVLERLLDEAEKQIEQLNNKET